MGQFADKVFAVVQQIPRGKVSTYGQIARIIGAPRSARYVGYALRANPAPGVDPDSIPCHRVIFKDGTMAKGFAFGGSDVQKQMLIEEGVRFIDDEHVDMNACLWNGDMDNAPQIDHDCSNCKRECPDRKVFPTAPPIDFDWERELGED